MTHAVVVAVGRGLAQHLVAFVVAGDIDLDVVRAHMAMAVPAYMLPARYYVLDELPLNHNGKVDRATLATWTSTEEATTPSEPPHDGWEQTLAAEWDLLLDNKVHSREDNFFALGGNSILATRLAGALRARFGAAASVRDLFTSPTVAGMANLLAHCANDQISNPDQAKKRGDVS